MENVGSSMERARIVLALDAASDMIPQYRSGKVQRVLDRLVSRFGGEDAIECWVFADWAKELAPLGAGNVEGYCGREVPWMSTSMRDSPIGGTNNEPDIIERIVERHQNAKGPVWVVFVSGGGVFHNREIEKLITDASLYPIFWQFVGIGGRNYGILEHLDGLTGRIVDNCDFVAWTDPDRIPESEFHERILRHFPGWIERARAEGLC
jgi:hypothetical protein